MNEEQTKVKVSKKIIGNSYNNIFFLELWFKMINAQFITNSEKLFETETSYELYGEESKTFYL